MQRMNSNPIIQLFQQCNKVLFTIISSFFNSFDDLLEYASSALLQFFTLNTVINLRMSTFDFANYQSLSSPFFLKSQHPYQPHHGHNSIINDQTLPYYETVKKDVQKMLIRQMPTAPEEPNDLTAAIKQIHQQMNHQRQLKFQGFHKDNVLSQAHSHNIHLQTKQKEQNIQQKQPQLKNTTLFCQEPLNGNSFNEGFKWNQIIVKQSLFPSKMDNYFQLSGGFNNSLFCPQKDIFFNVLSPQRYPYIFVSNLFLLLSLCLAFQLYDEMIWISFAGISLAYFIIVFRSTIAENIFGVKTQQNLQSEIKGLKQHRGYFMFHIQCYHFSKRASNQSKGNFESWQKTISYKLSQKFSVSESVDESFTLQNAEISTKYAEIKTIKQFYFNSKESEVKFIEAFNAFVHRNISDFHQKYHFTFEVDNSQKVKGMYCFEGNGFIMKGLFTFFSLIALCFPFTIFLQWQTKKLQAKVIKKISLQTE